MIISLDQNIFKIYNKRLYQIRADMIKRCYHADYKDYKYYGARNITICDEWLDSYHTFMYWALNNGYENHLTIDRINHRGNYEPSNCQWITKTENSIKSNKDRKNNTSGRR